MTVTETSLTPARHTPPALATSTTNINVNGQDLHLNVKPTTDNLKPMNITIYIGDSRDIGTYWNNQHDRHVDHLRSLENQNQGLKKELSERFEFCCECIRCLFCLSKKEGGGKKKTRPSSREVQTGSSLAHDGGTSDSDCCPDTPFTLGGGPGASAEAVSDFLVSYHVTRDEVLDWSKNFHSLMKDERGIKLFTLFCESEFSAENIKFFVQLSVFQEEIKGLTSTRQYVAELKKLYDDFISDSSPNQVSLTYSMQKKLAQTLETYHVLPSDADSGAEEDVGLGEVGLGGDPGGEWRRMEAEDSNTNEHESSGKHGARNTALATKTQLQTETTAGESETLKDQQTQPGTVGAASREECENLLLKNLGKRKSVFTSKIHQDTAAILKTIKEYIYNCMHRDSFQRFAASTMMEDIKAHYGM